MNITPLYDQIVIKILKDVDSNYGGIVIPDKAHRKSLHGKVIATGNGKLLPDGSVHSLIVKSGDTVLFDPDSGTEVNLDNVSYIIMREKDIFGILN